MYWIVVSLVTLGGILVTLAVDMPHGVGAVLGVRGVAEIVTLWLSGGFYGAATAMARLQHILRADAIAHYIGWPRGSGFQIELGFAELGIGLAGLASAGSGLPYAIAVCITGGMFYFGAGLVHVRDLARRGNAHAGNAGPVLVVDLLVPPVTIVALLLARI